MSVTEKTKVNPAIIINNATLTSSFTNATTGIVDLGEKSEQVIIYVKWIGGQTQAKLKVKAWTSPDNMIYYPVMMEFIADTAFSTMKQKEFWWEYLGSIQITAEEIDFVTSGVNNAGGRLTFANTPNTGASISIYHDGTAFGTVTEVAADVNFTAPASLAAGTVEWSLATGHLNFSSADVTSYSGQVIETDYTTNVNFVRIPIPVRDRFLKVALKEYQGAGGTATAYLSVTR